jgi:hypothetical protein
LALSKKKAQQRHGVWSPVHPSAFFSYQRSLARISGSSFSVAQIFVQNRPLASGKMTSRKRVLTPIEAVFTLGDIAIAQVL